MAKQYKILVNTGKAENNKVIDVPQRTGDRGQPIRIKAQAGNKYQLQELGKDQGKNTAPDYIRVQRKGKNLELTFEGGSSPDVIIEDYYSEMPAGYNGVIGQAENGSFYEYIPEDPNPRGLISELGDGAQPTSVVLGGDEVNPAGAAVALLAFNPLLGLLGAGAAAAVAADGNTGGGSTPTVTGALDAASDTGTLGDNRTNDKTPDISGKVAAGSTNVTVKIKDANGNVIYTANVTPNADGTYKFSVPTDLADGTYTPEVTATSNGTTTTTGGTPFTIDTVTNVAIADAGKVGTTNTISGTAEPGDTIVVKDANGNTIGTATANSSGQWSLTPTNPLPSGNITATATDAASNTASATGTPATNGADGLKTALTIDPIAGDNIINALESGASNYTITGKVTGKFAAGDAVILSLNSKTYSALVAADGSYSVPVLMADLLTDADTKIEATVKGTGGDNATAAQDYAVDTITPATKTALSVNAVTADNVLTAAENNGNITITITGTVSGKFAAGDVVTLTINGKTFTGAAAANGSYSISVPAADLVADSDTLIDAAVTGTGGTLARAIQDYGVDLSNNNGSKTALTIDPITGDNVITATESGATQTTITGKVSGKFAAGDTVTLTLNSKPYTAGVAADGSYQIKVNTTDLSTDSDKKIEGTVTGTGGDVATAAQTYTVESSNVVTKTALIIDPVTADNVLSSNETGTIAITGKVTGKFAAGDTVTLTVNGKTFSGTVDAGGSYSIGVPAADLNADSDTQVDGTVTGTGGTTAVAIQNYALDGINPTPTPPVSLKTALSLSPVTGDNILSTAEQGATTTTLSGKVTGTFVAGDVVTLKINGTPYTASVAADGSYSVSVQTADLKADSDHKIDASVTGTNGSVASAAQSYVLEDNANVGKVTALTIDPVTADNIIGSAESAGSIAITGKVTGAFAVGDTVTLTVNGKTFSGTVVSGGTYSIPVPAADLLADADTTVDGKVIGTGGTAAVAMQDYGIDPNINPVPTPSVKTALTINPITGDNILNSSESGAANTVVTGKVTGTFAAGDVVTLLVNNKTYTGSAAADGSYNISVPTADLVADPDTKIEGSVTGGNGGQLASAAQDYVLDANSPSAPTKTALSIDPITADNMISDAENTGAISVTGSVTGKFAAGDKVTLTINGKPYTGVADAAGKFTIPVLASDLVADSDTQVDGTVTGTGGTLATALQNYGTSITNPAPVPTPSAKTAIAIDPITGDNILNSAEQGSATITVIGKVTGAFAAGDTVTLSLNGQGFTTTVSADGSFNKAIATSNFTADADTKIEGAVTGFGGSYATAAQDYTLDANAPTDPKQTALSIDKVTQDNIIGVSEATGSITLTGHVTGKFAAGDVVTLVINGHNYTGTAAADGSYSVAVPAYELINDPDTTVDGQVTGTGGTTAAATQNYGVDSNVPVNPTPGPVPVPSLKTALSIDAITGDNIVNAADAAQSTTTITGHVTGAYAAGDRVTLTLNGKDYTANVAANGSYSVIVSTADLANDADSKIEGSVTGTSGSFATAAQDYEFDSGNTPSKTALSIDPVTTDNIIGSNENTGNINVTGKVTGAFSVGDQVTLTINGKTFRGTAAADGSYSIAVPAADLVADTDTTIEGTVRGTGGTTAAAIQNYGLDFSNSPNGGQALGLTIDTDANNDGFVNYAEMGNTAGVSKTVLTVSASFDGTKVAVGDVVTFTAADGTVKTVTLTAADLSAGKVSTTFTSPGDGATFSVKANLKDSAGNATPDATDTAKLDLSNLDPQPAPNNNGKLAVSVEITSDTNNDGTLNAAEVGTATTANVKVTLPTDAKAGDTLVITGTGNATQTITLSAAQVSAGNVTTTFNLPANGSKLDVTAQVSDTAGNTSKVATDSATVNTTPVGAPTVTITTDANNDGYINKSELGSSTTVNVDIGLPAGSAVGDIVTVTDGNGTTKTHTVTQADLTAGKYSETLAVPADGQSLTLSATATNTAGNTSPAGTDTAKVDTTSFVDPVDPTKSAVKVLIDTDANNDGLINNAELSATASKVKATITLPTTAVAGDTLTVNASGNATRTITLTAADITAGKVVLTDLNSTGDNTTFVVSASIKDAAGNASPTPDASDNATIMSAISGAPVVTITTDTNNDGTLNVAEINGSSTVTVTVALPTAAKAGDTLNVNIGGTVQSITLTSANITAQALTFSTATPANGTTLTAKATLTDAAGNISPEGMDTAKIASVGPNGGQALGLTIDTDANNDGFVNYAEMGNTAGVSKTVLTVSASFDGTKVAVGDVVTFTAADGTVKTVTLTAADLSAGKVSTTFTSPGDGATFSVKANLKDSAGNATPDATDTAKLDLSNLDPQPAPNNNGKLAVSVEITSDTNNDGTLNAAEVGTATTANVKVTLPTDAKAGDTLVITGTGNATQTITLSAAQVSAGNVTTTFNLPANGSKLDVTAQVSDAAGNTSKVATDSATVNTTPVGAPTVTITTDANNDGYINKSELGSSTTASVKVDLPSTAAVGDIIKVTDGSTINTITLTAADITARAVNTSFAAPANGNTLSVSATLTTLAGNTSGAGTDSVKVDTSATTAPTIKITTDTNDDGIIDSTELNGGANVNVDIGLPAGSAVGDIVTVTDGNGTTKTHTVTQADLTAGKYSETFTAPADGQTLSLSATLTDAAGNTSGAGTDSATMNTSANHAPTVTQTSATADPLGAATTTYSSFTAGSTLNSDGTTITGNGTYTFGGTTATVTGNTGTLTKSSNLSSGGTLNGLWLGDTSVDETATVTFSKAVSQVKVAFNYLDEEHVYYNYEENLVIYINGQHYPVTASMVSVENNAYPAPIDSNGNLNGVANNLHLYLVTVTIDAVPGTSGITSVAVMNDVVSGNTLGSIVAISATENTSTGTTATASATVQTLFGSYYADSDSGDLMRGVMVSGVGGSAAQTALGKYQYSHDGGTSWVDIAASVSESSALYLAKTDLVRFVPSASNTTGAKPDLTVHVVDSHSGNPTYTVGTSYDTTDANSGGSTSISRGTFTLMGPTMSIAASVDALNKSINFSTATATNENPQLFRDGTTLVGFDSANGSSLQAGDVITTSSLKITSLDIDTVTSTTANNMKLDRSQYGLGNGNLDWAVLLGYDNAQSTPGAYKFESKVGLFKTVSFKHSDLQRTTFIEFFDANGNSLGAAVEVAGGGAYDGTSASIKTFNGTVPNGASAAYFVITTTRDAWSIDTIVLGNTADQNLTDGSNTVDTTPTLTGTVSVAVTAGQKVQVFEGSTLLGEATLDTARTTWTFTPTTAQTAGTHTYTAKVVDTATGNTVIASSNYSLTINASPLVLDLNGDGVQTMALANGTQFDIDADGKVDAVGWASQQDGLLAIDLNGDGTINSGAELFGNHTLLADGTRAADGWAALAALDSNADGKIDAQDAAFAQLRVWQDANGDGLSGAGELRSLTDRGIVSIDLHADATSVAQNGNVLQGFSSFTTADGAQHAVADAWLDVRQSEVITLAHGESLDLSALLASGSKFVAGVDMSQDSAANVVKLSLADLLAHPAGAAHQLKLTGDSNDTVQLDLANWTNTGTTVTDNGHTYAVYNANALSSEQLLIDQHMLVTQHS